jgi:TetR/AcrR family transcriptional repressor of nem operon
MSPRTKEFEIDQVLDQAINLFWEKGYEATSIQELVDEMGIGRASLYATFGDKHTLYLAALDRYAEKVMSQNLRILSEGASGLAGIRIFFHRMLETSAQGEMWRGCLLTNAAIELATQDPDICLRIEQCLKKIDKAFTQALQQAYDQGEITDATRIAPLARYLTALFQGFVVLTRSHSDIQILRDSLEIGLSILH